jgi:hypothetical protein
LVLQGVDFKDFNRDAEFREGGKLLRAQIT